MIYINLILFVIVALVLRSFYKKREEVEAHLGWKIVGYYMLGIFSLTLNEWAIPVGFIGFLIFFKPTLNKKIKTYSAYTGLAMFALSFFILPYLEESIYEFPRKVEANGSNIYSFEFEENWQQIRDEFDINFAVLNGIKLEYTSAGKIENMRVEAVDQSNGVDRIYYWITRSGDGQFKVNRSRSEYQIDPYWQQGIEQMTVMNFFRMLDEVDFRDLRPNPDSERFELSSHDFMKTSYAVKGNEKFAINGSEVVEISNDQLPVYGYMVDICENDGTEKGCTEHTQYIFDAELNWREENHE
ncbi:hypothetical protein [Pseudalkalibacillus berkeleyi]|uniref:Uncharacterized protein n=1 Tax=Pseudalkalibacillus berkeleyi TaxID=1069813 RepID=A0ABS9GYG8_9BACL|nr:hypothetical protein [Pseudalkalibacillus berkeleyi]MCF6136582.1 hypothetical protein [Pseudalkalibacillus berkeleyi]